MIPAIFVQIGDKLKSSANVGLLHPVSGQPSMNNYFNAWLWVKQSLAGAILCVISVILIYLLLIITNVWQCYLTTLKFLRRDDWWDNQKMRARKILKHCWQTGWFRYCDNTKVNSMCDIPHLDQIGPISVQDVYPTLVHPKFDKVTLQIFGQC